MQELIQTEKNGPVPSDIVVVAPSEVVMDEPAEMHPEENIDQQPPQPIPKIFLRMASFVPVSSRQVSILIEDEEDDFMDEYDNAYDGDHVIFSDDESDIMVGIAFFNLNIQILGKFS